MLTRVFFASRFHPVSRDLSAGGLWLCVLHKDSAHISNTQCWNLVSSLLLLSQGFTFWSSFHCCHFTLQATDNDAGQNGLINYSINDGNISDVFRMNSSRYVQYRPCSCFREWILITSILCRLIKPCRRSASRKLLLTTEKLWKRMSKKAKDVPTSRPVFTQFLISIATVF